MKKTNLALAILVAVGLTACGSGSDGDKVTKPETTKPETTKPVDVKKDAKREAFNKAKTEKKLATIKAADLPKDITKAEKKAWDDAVVAAKKKIEGTDKVQVVNDATETAVIKGQGKTSFDKVSRVQSAQYVRENGSKFDRQLNPSKTGTSSALSKISLDVQNPALTNFVVGRENIKIKSGQAAVVRYAGNLPGKADTIQKENTKNVIIDGTNAHINHGNNELNNGLLTATGINGKLFSNVVGSDEDQLNSSRVFGNKFVDEKNEKVENSYSRGVIDANGDIEAEHTRLEFVQYGRISNNIDPVDPKGTFEKDGKGNKFKVAPFVKRNAKDKDSKAVNTYFYRGNHATTPEQMAKLPKKTTYTYEGHAITYGLEHSVKANLGNGPVEKPKGPANLAGAFQIEKGKPVAPAKVYDTNILGSFVEADLVVGTKTAAVKNGRIFDKFVAKDHATGKVVAKGDNNLVTFEAGVRGNTFVGTAVKVVGQEKGRVSGSFFGAQAQEMGGTVNSIVGTAKNGYGDAKWGASFGAKRMINDGLTPIEKKTQPKGKGPENTWLVEDAEELYDTNAFAPDVK